MLEIKTPLRQNSTIPASDVVDLVQLSLIKYTLAKTKILLLINWNQNNPFL
jgi:hypothetical protein